MLYESVRTIVIGLALTATVVIGGCASGPGGEGSGAADDEIAAIAPRMPAPPPVKSVRTTPLPVDFWRPRLKTSSAERPTQQAPGVAVARPTPAKPAPIPTRPTGAPPVVKKPAPARPAAAEPRPSLPKPKPAPPVRVAKADPRPAVRSPRPKPPAEPVAAAPTAKKPIPARPSPADPPPSIREPAPKPPVKVAKADLAPVDRPSEPAPKKPVAAPEPNPAPPVVVRKPSPQPDPMPSRPEPPVAAPKKSAASTPPAEVAADRDGRLPLWMPASAAFALLALLVLWLGTIRHGRIRRELRSLFGVDWHGRLPLSQLRSFMQAHRSLQERLKSVVDMLQSQQAEDGRFYDDATARLDRLARSIEQRRHRIVGDVKVLAQARRGGETSLEKALRIHAGRMGLLDAMDDLAQGIAEARGRARL